MNKASFFVVSCFLAAACSADTTGTDEADSSAVVCADAVGFDTIAGDLPGVVTAQARPYLVASDIYIPQGNTVIIEAGAVFLFKSFTGLHVSGTLLARGIKNKPIVFTSENDRQYNPRSGVDPAPFDWNGIYIHEDGIGSHLAYCAVLYSVEGIISLTKFIRINTCLFLHNGRANLTIDGKQHQVMDQPYDYTLLVKDPSMIGIPQAILKDPLAVSRTVIRSSGIIAASCGCIIAIIWGSKFNLSSHTFNSMSAKDRNNLATHSSAFWTAARMNRNRDFALFMAGIGICITGGVGIGWSFTF